MARTTKPPLTEKLGATLQDLEQALNDWEEIGETGASKPKISPPIVVKRPKKPEEAHSPARQARAMLLRLKRQMDRFEK